MTEVKAMRKSTLAKAIKTLMGGVFAPLQTAVILCLTGIAEQLLPFGMLFWAWMLEILLCFGSIPIMYLIEKKLELGDCAVPYNIIYFVIGAFSLFTVIPYAASIYVSDVYTKLPTYNPAESFNGFQWNLYLMTALCGLFVYLIVRIMLAIVKKIKSNRKY